MMFYKRWWATLIFTSGCFISSEIIIDSFYGTAKADLFVLSQDCSWCIAATAANLFSVEYVVYYRILFDMSLLTRGLWISVAKFT